MTTYAESASAVRTPQEVAEEYLGRLHRREEAAFDLVAEDFVQHAATPQGRAECVTSRSFSTTTSGA